MEFMMIRTVKSAATGNSGGDIQRPTLGLISGGGSNNSSGGSICGNHHNNLYQHHQQQGAISSITQGSTSVGGATSLVGAASSYSQQQLNHSTSFVQNNSYDNKYLVPRFPTSNVGGSWGTDTKYLLGSTNTSGLENFGSPQTHRKKSPPVFNVVIKNKEILNRISSTNANCVQKLVPGVASDSSSNSANNNVTIFGQQQHNNSNSQLTSQKKASSVAQALSPDCSKTVFRKMKKHYWETLHQKSKINVDGVPVDSTSTPTSTAAKKSCRVREKLQTPKINVSTLLTPTPAPSLYKSTSSSFSKKYTLQKQQDVSKLMPNLLKSFKWSGEAGNPKLRKTSDILPTNSNSLFKTPCTTGVLDKNGIPIQNIFLQKYDPIRLMRRLRSCSPNKTTAAIVKNIVSPRKEKIITVNSFPFAPRRTHKSKKVVVKGKRKKKRKKGTHGGRKQSKKRRTKRKTKLPKYSSPTRKTNVRYWSPSNTNSSYAPLTTSRFRVIAAVYLKRAVARLRLREAPSSSVIQRRLKKMKAKRKLLRARTNNSSQVRSQGLGPLVKFHVTQSKLPRPIVIKSHPVSLLENPSLIHTLQLLRHKRELQDRLETIDHDGTVQKVGPLPEKPAADACKVPFLVNNVPLKRRQVKHVISQKLLICLANVGFTHSKLRPLEVMADVTANFFTKMAQRLKEVSEMEMYGVDHGFPDTMERVLIETGVGGIRGLEEFYRTKVTDYGHRMEEQCLLLRRQYAYKVRSKVGMMSNVSTSTTSNISASASSSSSSVTNSSAPTSAISSNNISSTASPSSILVVSGGGGSSSAATGAVASKSTLMAKSSSSSSQPLSPGNSVLAEMLSSQEDLLVRTPQGCPSPSLGTGGTVERHLEELMGAPPPNVEIRPNSFPHHHHPHQHRQPQLVHQQQQQQQQQQQVPLHHLLASLSQPQQQSPQSRHQQQQQQHQQQQHQQQQQQSLLPPPSPQQQQTLNPYVNTLYASSPPLTPPTPPHHHLNQKVYHQQQPPHPASSQGQSQNQQQSHLTQLLQRPITSQPSPTMAGTPPATATTNHQHHLILHHHHPQQGAPQQASQFHHPLHHVSHRTSPNQQSPVRNTNINTTIITATKSSPHHPSQASHPGPATVVAHQGTRQLGHTPTPLQPTMPKVPDQQTSLDTGEQTYSSNTTTPSVPPTRTAVSSNGAPSPSNSNMQQGGKLITIIRSSSSQQGIIVNSNHHNYQNSVSSGRGAQDSNVISINLGAHADVDGGGASPTSSSSLSSKTKLKEAISQRNLLRLNFEQVPSGAGDSTVLLSSSSVAAASAVPPPVGNNSVQFIGKVSGGGVSWNNTTNYS